MSFAIDPYDYMEDGSGKTALLEQQEKFIKEFFGLDDPAFTSGTSRFASSESLRRFMHSVDYWDHLTDKELSPTARVLSVVTLINTIEGIVMTRGNAARVVLFLGKYLNENEKQRFLASFIFSPPFQLGEESGAPRHLMYEEKRAAGYNADFPEEAYCYTSFDDEPVCDCVRWLREQSVGQLDAFMNELSNKLYAMRNSVIHDAGRVLFVHDETRPVDAASWGASLADAFRNDDGSFTAYESGLSKSQLISIFKDALKRCFENPQALNGASLKPTGRVGA